MIAKRDILGRGFAFPPRLTADGRWAWSSGQENVRENVRVILMTELGERLMLPRFGAGLTQFLHEPNVLTTHRLIQDRVKRALDRWERRIAVEAIDVAADPEDPRAAIITVRYQLVATGAAEHVGVTLELSA